MKGFKIIDQTTALRWKYYSRVIKIRIFYAAYATAVFMPPGLSLKIDPFSFTLPRLLPTEDICGESKKICSISIQVLIWFLRIVIGTIGFLEGCRFLSFFSCFILYWIELFDRCVDSLENFPADTKHFDLFSKLY